MIRSLLTIIGGLIIGFGIIAMMTWLICLFGFWGWFFLPIVLALAIFLAILVICLPYSFEERQSLKKYERTHHKGD